MARLVRASWKYTAKRAGPGIRLALERLEQRMKPSLNWLLVFLPITLLLEHIGTVAPPVLFFSAALALIPIASLIVHAT